MRNEKIVENIVESNDQNDSDTIIENIDYFDDFHKKMSTSQFNFNRKSNFANSSKNVEMTSNFEDLTSNDVNMSFDMNFNVNFDDRILHSNSHSNFTIIERTSKVVDKSKRIRNFSTKSRLNEH